LRFINALDCNHKTLRAMRLDLQAGTVDPHLDGLRASLCNRLRRALMPGAFVLDRHLLVLAVEIAAALLVE